MIPISGEMIYVYNNKFPLIPQVLLQKIPKKPFVTKACNKGFLSTYFTAWKADSVQNAHEQLPLVLHMLQEHNNFSLLQSGKSLPETFHTDSASVSAFVLTADFQIGRAHV